MHKPVAILILLITLATAGCDWNGWKAGNIQEIPLTQGIRDAITNSGGDGNRGGYAVGIATGRGEVAMNWDCNAGACMQSLGDNTFWSNHEYGHIVYRDLGYFWGSDNINQERGANCVAEVLTNRGPNFIRNAEGYWDCPAQEVINTRRRMYDAGMLDEAKQQVEMEYANA